ncbi:TolC family outer membrane protein [Haematospirillum jordaniae]|uniref:TolC family outer membrane protein n=1 Tax=Haematospirillum jordaniae TaxID=1549855 RepID=UPI0014331C0F|nr:TolC family outer membrane protein [Haematospirillum jordaniae]NKD82995.1 TolC family outer membrane protein [Haematospirillum jordaniae]
MKKTLSVFAAAAFFPGLVFPVCTQAMSLEDALAAAYAGNPELQADRARVRAVDEKVPQALSGWRPRVQLSGTSGYARDHSNTRQSRDGYQSSNPRTVSVKLEQDIFSGFRTVNDTKAAENTVKAARAQLAVTEQTVLQSVAESYLNVVRDQAVVDLNRNNEQVLARQLEATQDRFRVGELTRTDVSQSEARLAEATADRINAEAQLKASRANFERLVGLPADDMRYPSEPPHLPASLDEAVEASQAMHPNVLAAEFSAEAAQNTVDATGGELMPAVKLQADQTKTYDQSLDGARTKGYRIMAVVDVPLYEAGGATWSRLREAKQKAGQARLQVDDARNKSRELAVRAWESLVASRAQIESIQAQIEAATVALEGVQREAQVGSRTVLDVLDAEQELLNARVSLVTAQRNERVAAHSLLSAVGRLDAKTLGLDVGIYDPIEHYNDVEGAWFGS